jgi:hypothetical protein
MREGKSLGFPSSRELNYAEIAEPRLEPELPHVQGLFTDTTRIAHERRGGHG